MDKVILKQDVIVVEDHVDQQCIRHVHLMSNSAFNCTPAPFPIGKGAVTQEGGVWHLRVEYPYRGALDFPYACVEGNYRRLVVWSLDGYELIKLALMDAWYEYVRLFHGAPQFAFIKTLPSVVQNGYQIGGMTLMETEWMLEKCVAVGCKL